MKRNNFTRKNILLAVVALVLVLMMAVGATYSWIEDIKLVQVQMTDDGDSKPLTVGQDIYATAEITTSTDTIDLGSMIKDSKADANGVDGIYNAEGKYVTKGYFYESGDMHLSPCYSDGEEFYFPVDTTQMNGKDSSDKYRLGNKDDENVNYISMTVKVASYEASADFWFDSIPTIKNSATKEEISGARYAITVDGDTKVFSELGYDCNTVPSITATSTQVVSANRLARFTYGDPENTTSDLGKNGNILFSVEKGDSVTLTVKIWLEEGAASYTNLSDVDIDLTLVSSMNKKHKILFQDNTTGAGAESWLGNDGARMFLAVPNLRSGSGWVQDESYWEMKKDTTLTNQAGKDVYHPVDKSGKQIDLPAYVNGEKVYFLRCSSSGWNQGDNRGSLLSDIGVTYFYNYWDANIPNIYDTSKFTVYGGTFDDNLTNRFGNKPQSTFRGNGTWGSVALIEVMSDISDNPAPATNADDNLIIADHTDEEIFGATEIHYQTMFWNKSISRWQAYVPTSSTKIEFWYHRWQGGAMERNWGYHSNCEYQIRPTGANVYHLTSTTKGYWQGAGQFYFINTRNWNPPYVYLWDKTNTGSNNYYKGWHGEPMTKTDMTVKVNNTTYNVYSYTVDSNNVKYNDLIFNDGTSGTSNEGNGAQTKDLTVQIGKYYYYDYSNGKDNGYWLDSLSEVPNFGGSTGDDDGGSSGGNDSSANYDGYPNNSQYCFWAYVGDDQSMNNNQNLTFKANSSNTSFRYIVELRKDVGCYFNIRNLNGNKDYGVQGSTWFVRESGTVGFNNEYGNRVEIKADVTGKYIIDFTLSDGKPQVKVTYPAK